MNSARPIRSRKHAAFRRSFALVSTIVAVLSLLGCASSEIKLAAPLGPRPGAPANPENLGTLQVFTAGQPVAEDVNFEEFFAGDDFLKECEDPAHMDYTLYSAGSLVPRKVKNAVDSWDPMPTSVRLPPGRYQVKAQAETADGVRSVVSVPVVIRAGRITRVHLRAPWTPSNALAGADLVRLPNGQPVGWRATGAQDDLHGAPSEPTR